ARTFKGAANDSPLLGGEGRGEDGRLTYLRSAGFIGLVYSGKECGARDCNSLKIVSRILCALRRKWEFQNRSVLMPRDCINFSCSASCLRWSGKPCWLPSNSTFNSASSQKKSRS